MERLSNYAFYGTLRLGMENYQSLAKSLKYLKTVSLTGYRMYSLVEYPYIVHTDDERDRIIVELFSVTDAETEEMIYEMEIEAGYIRSTIVIDGSKFGIYIFQMSDPAHDSVPDGDWVRHTRDGLF